MNGRLWNVFLSQQSNFNTIPTPESSMTKVETYLIRIRGGNLLTWMPPERYRRILVLGATGPEVKAFKQSGYTTVQGATVIMSDVAHGNTIGETLVLSDFHVLREFPSNSFDAIYSHHSFEHALAPLLVATAARRVLVDRGRIFFVVPVPDGERSLIQDPKTVTSQHYSLLEPDVWCHILKIAGFESISYTEAGSVTFMAEVNKKTECPGKIFEDKLRGLGL